MQSSNVQVLGVHPIVSTPELERGAFDIKFGALCLSDMEKRDALQHIRSELGSVYLVEVKVDASDGVVDIGRFHQPGSDQVPYDERYLSTDGDIVVAEAYDVPTTPQLRVAFFLHFLDLAKSLETPYGLVALPEPSPMPERLARLVPYEPVD